jgi:MoaA/NifB/PqqE/SkfB family radical SAM enzyme
MIAHPSPNQGGADEERGYCDNLILNRSEYRQQHLYLQSWPRFLGVVLANSCNLDCPHCYQARNTDNLLRPAAIGRELRREFAGFYPYLSTLRIQGGEPFACAGFDDLVEDVRRSVRRPILSISTNGTLIDERRSEQIVSTPFRTVTVSIDGATPATYARLRKGADLDQVLENLRRIERGKRKRGSDLPYVDSFFVLMRSNFRELPLCFDLMRECGVAEVTLQTMEVNAVNSARVPTLEAEEAIRDRAEVCELRDLLLAELPRAKRQFRAVRTCGLTSLLHEHGLDAAFLEEGTDGLYPDSNGMINKADGLPLCPNPWTTLFVAENGDVHLCFLAEPVANLYETPLAAVWNSRAALAKRSRMISGRYRAAGCSERWCSWREGRKPAAEPTEQLDQLRAEMAELAVRARRSYEASPEDPAIAAVRRMLLARDRRIRELEAEFAQLCDANETLHQRGREHIAHLEVKCDAAIEDFQRLEKEYWRLRRHPLVRLAGWLAKKGPA